MADASDVYTCEPHRHQLVHQNRCSARHTRFDAVLLHCGMTLAFQVCSDLDLGSLSRPGTPCHCSRLVRGFLTSLSLARWQGLAILAGEAAVLASVTDVHGPELTAWLLECARAASERSDHGRSVTCLERFGQVALTDVSIRWGLRLALEALDALVTVVPVGWPVVRPRSFLATLSALRQSLAGSQAPSFIRYAQ